MIFQQAGLEPIDAYGIFLKEREEKNSFQIFDPYLKKPLHQFHKNVNSDVQKHFVVPEKQAKFYFEKPYWLRTKEEMKSNGF